MPMVNIGKMRMAMPQKAMLVRMSVRLAAVPVKRMLMQMMLVMRMGVRVRHRLVNVVVHVIFGDV